MSQYTGDSTPVSKTYQAHTSTGGSLVVIPNIRTVVLQIHSGRRTVARQKCRNRIEIELLIN